MTPGLWPCRRPTSMLPRLLRASSSVADVMPAGRRLDLPIFLDRRGAAGVAHRLSGMRSTANRRPPRL